MPSYIPSLWVSFTNKDTSYLIALIIWPCCVKESLHGRVCFSYCGSENRFVILPWTREIGSHADSAQ